MAKKTLSLLTPARNEPSAPVIDLLQRLLVKAQAGEISGIATVLCYPPNDEDPMGSFGSAYIANPGRDAVGFLGTLRVLETRIMTQVYVPERDND